MTESLIDQDHPYSGGVAHGNFFKSGWAASEASWDDFMEYAANWDLDYSFVYRWDWQVYKDAEGEPTHRLSLFWVQQRKGILGSHTIRVMPADEERIRAWLEIRWQHLLRVWAPFAPPVVTEEAEDPPVKEG